MTSANVSCANRASKGRMLLYLTLDQYNCRLRGEATRQSTDLGENLSDGLRRKPNNVHHSLDRQDLEYSSQPSDVSFCGFG